VSENWDQLEDMYGPVLYRIARSKGWNHEDSQDLVQQAWLAAWKGHQTWNGHPPEACLKQSLKYVMMDAKRKRFGRSTVTRGKRYTWVHPQFITNMDDGTFLGGRSRELSPPEQAILREHLERE